MKLREAVSWIMGTLQRNLVPLLEECGERPLTDKERQLVSILELVQIEKFAGRLPRRFGRKPCERQGRQSAPEALAELPVYGSPVPLPGAVWLLGSGLLGLVGLRRKFKK